MQLSGSDEEEEFDLTFNGEGEDDDFDDGEQPCHLHNYHS